uniref:Glucuronosyltransferase n=1 Tax=Megaselia scalaris TaxID=36166 RepID=T1H342_MEGSC
MRGIQSIKMMDEYAITIALGIAVSEGYKTLMNYPDYFKFDLIINDYTMGPHLLAFVHKFNYPPLIGMTAFLNSPNTVDLIGHHYFSGYIPYWSTTYDTNMTFWERFENTFIYVYDCLIRKYVTVPKLDKIFLPISPPNTPSLGDLQRNTKLAFVNSNPAINYPESLPPNVIEIGGMHIKEPKELPKNIEEFMSKSKNGAIFVAFGTNVNSEMLKGKVNDAIFKVIEDLPEYNFLLKFDLSGHNYTIPKNVLVQKFFPQREILNHPNLKVFVTHSGGLSTQEATWAGVPTVGFAVIVDNLE